MADTQRDLAALQALLADNITKDISPQDMRDVLVSTLGCYGGLHMAAAPGAQVIGVTPLKVTGWDTVVINDGIVVGNLTDDDIDVSVAGVYLAVFTISWSGSANVTWNVDFYVDDVFHRAGAVRKLGADGDVGDAMGVIPISLTAGQVLSIYATADGAAKNFTPATGTFCAIRLA